MPPFHSDGDPDAAALGQCRGHGMVEIVERSLEDGAHQPYLDAVAESLRPPAGACGAKVSSDEEEDDEKAPGGRGALSSNLGRWNQHTLC